MRLSQWNNTLSWVTDKGSLLESSGIIECHRFFYIFFDPEHLKERLLGTMDKTKSYYGKAIQINLSLNKGGKDNIDILPWFRGSGNSTYMTIGMYTYDIISQGVVDVNERTDFILNEALLSSTTNDYEIKKSILNGTNVYSKDLRDKEDLKNSVQMSLSSYAPNIPDPRFYTIKHQESVEDDVYCITSLTTSICHKGVDLLDDFTSISIMKTGDLDTLEPAMKSKIYNLRNSIRISDYKLGMCDPTE
ncbi:MAG: hypothetical protein K2N99_02515, partial [Malacoplasma sp.]|nr:hypothetical protein [Malacoplasma sp.]